jgi:dihydrodipicolinate reductase
VFARGALLAARWVRGRKGVYSFDHVAKEILDPLFAFGD